MDSKKILKIKKIIFIIVNYNGSDDTVKCIDSIVGQNCDNTKVEIIIADNFSKTSDLEKIKSHCKNTDFIKYFEIGDNVGYFPAFNLTIDKYRKNIVNDNTSIVLCNNDLVFSKNFITNYFVSDYDSDTLVVSPNVITLNGTRQNPHVLNRFSIVRKLLLRLYFSSYFVGNLLGIISQTLKKKPQPAMEAKSQYIYAGIGACYILPPTFFKKFYNVDARTFLGGEELLLAAQILSVGGKNYYDKDIVVTHAEGVTFSKNTSRWRYEQSKSSYAIYKNLL